MSGYTAVITGGNKGIGADLAAAMVARGWHVVSLARHAGETADVEHLICDLSDPDAVEKAGADIAARHEVTHFVQNAGIILPNLIEDARPADMLALTQLHLGAALALTQAFLPAMKARGFGRILFNASRAALGAKTRTAYSASKPSYPPVPLLLAGSVVFGLAAGFGIAWLRHLLGPVNRQDR